MNGIIQPGNVIISPTLKYLFTMYTILYFKIVRYPDRYYKSFTMQLQITKNNYTYPIFKWGYKMETSNGV